MLHICTGHLSLFNTKRFGQPFLRKTVSLCLSCTTPSLVSAVSSKSLLSKFLKTKPVANFMLFSRHLMESKEAALGKVTLAALAARLCVPAVFSRGLLLKKLASWVW